MSTKQKTDIRGFLPNLFYPGLTFTQTKRLRDIHDYLLDGPRTTDEIVKHCGVNYDDVTEVLNYGFRCGTLNKQSQRGYTGRGKRPKKWSNNDDGIRSEAAKKLPFVSPLEAVDEELRVKLLEMDPAKCEQEVSDHQLYYVAELCAAIELFPGLHFFDLATKLDIHDSSVRSRAKLAEQIGVITIDRPSRKGTIGRPHNTAKNNCEGIDELRTPGHRSQPARSKKQLIHLTPKKDRCTGEQRRWLSALTAKDAKLSEFDHQAMTRVLFPSFGTERFTTYGKIAKELGCGVTALEKPIARLKDKGWMEVEKDAGGEGGRETAFRPTWERAEAVYKRVHRRNGKPKAASNSAAKKRSAPKEVQIETPPKARKRGPAPTYDHVKTWLEAEVRAGRDGKPFDLRSRYKDECEGNPVPVPRTFSAYLSAARRKVREKRATDSAA